MWLGRSRFPHHCRRRGRGRPALGGKTRLAIRDSLNYFRQSGATGDKIPEIFDACILTRTSGPGGSGRAVVAIFFQIFFYGLADECGNGRERFPRHFQKRLGLLVSEPHHSSLHTPMVSYSSFPGDGTRVPLGVHTDKGFPARPPDPTRNPE